MPLIARTHAALRRSSSVDERQAAVEPLLRARAPRSARAASQRLARALVGERREHLRRVACAVGGDHAEAPQILGGQVDAADLGVLAHVAQDVRQLQRDAEVVGERFGGRAVDGGGACARAGRARLKIARQTRPIAPATRRQ